jgi:hypothetical protein
MWERINIRKQVPLVPREFSDFVLKGPKGLGPGV